MSDAWFHSIDPFVWQISGNFGIRWYGIAYLLGFVAGFALLYWLAKRGSVRTPKSRTLDVILILVFGVVLGGRLGFAIVYEPELFTTFTRDFPFWGLLKIHKGGMASHGGMVGVAVAAWVISRGFPDERTPEGRIERIGRCPVLHVFDIAAFIAPPGLMLGRLANFVNGELLGKIVAMPGERGPWWSVQYPQELGTKQAPELTEAQKAALEQAVNEVRTQGQTFSEALDVLLLKAARHDPHVIEQLRPLVSARHPSQLYQAFAEGVVVFAVLFLVWLRPRKPGVISAWFLIVYGIGRILTELWRLPDAQFAMQRIAGLSRGQWLSVAMVVIGCGLLAWVSRRPDERIGGILRPAA